MTSPATPPARPSVVVVHLARHRARRKRLSALLRRHGFTRVAWLDAVDGAKLPANPPWDFGGKKSPRKNSDEKSSAENSGEIPDDFGEVSAWRNWADPYARRAMTLGEVGCALSHVRAWRHIAEDGYPSLVLEDDADAVEPLLEDLPLLMQDLDYIEFELCYLSQRNAPGPKFLAGRHIHVVDYHPLWTLAYLLTPPGARKLLATPWQTQLIPADEMLPACFGLNREAEVNRAYAQAPGLVVAANQRFFTPAESSANSETEKSAPVRAAKNSEPELLGLTVATEKKPELRRLLHSGRRYGLEIEPLGLGANWRGGDVANSKGGGQKINLLRPALQKLPEKQPVLFVDGYDTIITRHAGDILRAWREIAADEAPLFAAEVFCWPDKSRADSYPAAPDGNPYRFLNSGAFIGRAGDLLNILNGKIADADDDQGYYTEKFLSGKHRIALDHHCKLFQCLNGALQHAQVDEGRGMFFNRHTESWPAVIHANGPSKQWLDKEGRAVGGRRRTHYGEME